MVTWMSIVQGHSNKERPLAADQCCKVEQIINNPDIYVILLCLSDTQLIHVQNRWFRSSQNQWFGEFCSESLDI